MLGAFAEDERMIYNAMIYRDENAQIVKPKWKSCRCTKIAPALHAVILLAVSISCVLRVLLLQRNCVDGDFD